MTAKDFTEFQTLVEQFQVEMSLKDICTQENIDYRSYISWRKRMGYSKKQEDSRPGHNGRAGGHGSSIYDGIGRHNKGAHRV
ncbi:MAG: hypothetical protein JFR40_06860 [Muribaculaceae bacterium]|nr:hypothetical protein [Muribaculaceae bacterium]